MKHSAFIFFSILLTLLGCKKEDSEREPEIVNPDNEIVGAWKLHYYFPPWGLPIYPHPDTVEYYLVFRNDNSLIRIINQGYPNDTVYTDYGIYDLRDSITAFDTTELLWIDSYPQYYQIQNDTTLYTYSLLGTDPAKLYYNRYNGKLP